MGLGGGAPDLVCAVACTPLCHVQLSDTSGARAEGSVVVPAGVGRLRLIATRPASAIKSVVTCEVTGVATDQVMAQVPALGACFPILLATPGMELLDADLVN